MAILRVIVLLLSLLGFLQRTSMSIRPDFAPGVVVCFAGSVMFLSGILGILPVGVYTLLASGLFLLIYALIKKQSFRCILSFSNCLLLLLLLYFFLTLHGMKLTGYDDFSHWGLITRILVTRDRFPNAEDLNLTFQAYPPGSAAFIYFVTKASGLTDEWVWLYAQAAAVLSLFVSLLAFGKNLKEKIILTGVLLILLCSNTFFINLLVDTLITSIAVCLHCFCLYYREELKDKRLYLLPMLIYLTAVKTSGLFYYAIACCYVLIREHSAAIKWKKWLPVFAVGLVPLVLWRWHVRVTFQNGMLTKHALSLEYFLKTIGDKNWGGMKFILVQMIKELLSPKREVLYLLAFVLLLFLSCRKALTKQKECLLREVLILVFISALAYTALLYLMYLFSMPWYEASVLAGFERYLRTFTAFACAILSAALLNSFPIMEWESTAKSVASIIIWLAILLLTMGRRPDFYLRWPMETEPRTYADQMIENYHIPKGMSYIVMLKEEPEDGGYLSYMFRYVLDSKNVKLITAEQLVNETPTQEDADFFIAYEWDETIQKELENRYGERADRVVALRNET